MTNRHVCPTDGKSYPDEDYCPVHGVPLVADLSNDPSPASTHTGESVPDRPETKTADLGEANSIPEKESSASGENGESKLDRFMKRFGFRIASEKTPNEKDEIPSSQSSAPEASSPLPEDVTEKGWKLAGPIPSEIGVDAWQVEKATASGPVTGIFRRYRIGSLTTVATYRRLMEITTPFLARVWAHGTVDFGGARAEYDLVSLPVAGVALDKWLAETPPSEQRAMHLFEALVRLLVRLSALELRPIVFEPSQVVRADNGELCLAWVGAMAEAIQTDAEAIIQYRPEFRQSALLPNDWAAPELVQQMTLSDNASVFSLGQILARATWGQPFSHAELQTGAVPFYAISDARLARVLMGCLWPRSKGRWTCTDLANATECSASDAMPTVSPWASLAPGASSTSFSFGGESYWRMEDLVAAATQPAHWSEATSRLEAILGWAEGTAWVGQARLMQETLAAGRSADWALVSLARIVCPDGPLNWRDLDLTDAEVAKSLAGLAQRALQGSAADIATMRDLFKADLRGAFAPDPSRF